MAEPILFNPENRLLGSSTGDFSLYGGQATPTVSLRPAQNDARSIEKGSALEAGEGSSSAAPSLSEAAPASSALEAMPQDAGAGAPAAFLISTPFGFLPPAASDQIMVPALAPATPAPESVPIPAPHGSGTMPTLTPPPGPSSDEQGGGSHLDSLALPAAQAALSFVPVIAPVAGAIEGVVGSTLTSTVDATAGLVTATLDTTGELVGTTVDATGELIGGTVDAADNLVGTVADTADQLVTTTLDTVGDTVTQAGGTIGDVASSVPPLTEAALGTAHTLTDVAAPIVTATVGAVNDSLEGVTGSDPEGGIATLVSLVSVADMFDLQPASAEASDESSDLGFDLLDSLADADTLDPLLGGGSDHHDGHGLFDHGSDHPLGL